jgi:transcriptional regulator with XRE-family HTH domain
MTPRAPPGHAGPPIKGLTRGAGAPAVGTGCAHAEGMTSSESLTRRARRALGLDVEAFADLLGLDFHVVEGWEHGPRRPSGVVLALLHLLIEEPRRCQAVLTKVRDDRHALRERILAAVRDQGRGPKHSLPLLELRQAVAFRQGPMGRERIAGATAEEVEQLLLALEHERLVDLEPSKHSGGLTIAEQEAAIRHRRRGLLTYVRAGPRLSRATRRHHP